MATSFVVSSNRDRRHGATVLYTKIGQDPCRDHLRGNQQPSEQQPTASPSAVLRQVWIFVPRSVTTRHQPRSWYTPARRQQRQYQRLCVAVVANVVTTTPGLGKMRSCTGWWATVGCSERSACYCSGTHRCFRSSNELWIQATNDHRTFRNDVERPFRYTVSRFEPSIYNRRCYTVYRH